MLSENEIGSYSTARIEALIVQANEQLNTMLKEMAQQVKVLQYKEVDHFKERLKNELVNRKIKLLSEVKMLDESVNNADNWMPNKIFSNNEKNNNFYNYNDDIYSHNLNNDFNNNNNVETKRELQRVNPQELIEKYRMLIEAQSGNILVYRGIHIPTKPRAFSCLFVMGRHATEALSVKTIYEKAIEYEVDAKGLDPYADNITEAWVIRSEIREALYKATEEYRNKVSKEEIKNLLNSDKSGKIRLRIPKKDVIAIGPLDEYPCR